MLDNNENIKVDEYKEENVNIIESSSDNRNSNNNSCCEKKCTPNIPMYNFEFTNIGGQEDKNCKDKLETKKELINKIRSLDFAIVELAEYLDTHSEDKKALTLHKEYANALMELKEKYQVNYGPLDINFPCNKWRWLEEPWPWERGNL